MQVQVPIRHGSFTGRLLLALAVAAVMSPGALHGQQQAETLQISQDRLTAYAGAYVEIASARDDAHDALAESGNKTDEAQERIREELAQQIEDIVQTHGLTLDEYERITLVISIDQEQAQAFENALEMLDDADAADGQGAGEGS